MLTITSLNFSVGKAITILQDIFKNKRKEKVYVQYPCHHSLMQFSERVKEERDPLRTHVNRCTTILTN